jgi:hypothetical protein
MFAPFLPSASQRRRSSRRGAGRIPPGPLDQVVAVALAAAEAGLGPGELVQTARDAVAFEVEGRALGQRQPDPFTGQQRPPRDQDQDLLSGRARGATGTGESNTWRTRDNPIRHHSTGTFR